MVRPVSTPTPPPFPNVPEPDDRTRIAQPRPYGQPAPSMSTMPPAPPAPAPSGSAPGQWAGQSGPFQPVPPPYGQAPYGQPTPGSGGYGQPTPPAQPAPYGPPVSLAKPRRSKRLLGGIGGAVGVVLILALKIGLPLVVHHAVDDHDHGAKDAESVVTNALQSNTAAQAERDFASTLNLKSPATRACVQLLSNDAEFSIAKSSMNGDGSATVDVDLKDSSHSLDFHLIQQSGWKIDQISCS